MTIKRMRWKVLCIIVKRKQTGWKQNVMDSKDTEASKGTDTIWKSSYRTSDSEKQKSFSEKDTKRHSVN